MGNLLKDKFKFSFLLITLAILSFFPNINLYEFRGEESLRTIVAFEMAYNHNLLQPTFLGDLYFNKPPLFNWFIIFSSYLIPWSELTARIISIFFVLLTLILIYKFSFKLTKNKEISILASLIYITFVDILFWYGYLAEIDATLAFFIFLMFYFLFLGYKEKKGNFLILAGIITGIAFLLKGFPAYAFFGLSYLALLIYHKAWKGLFNPYIWIGGIFSLLIPLIWIFNTANPDIYLQRLFLESFNRVEQSKDFSKFLIHLISYPVLNIKQILPASLFVLIGIFIYRKNLKIPSEIKLLLFVVFINYLPYLISVGSRGRYIIPLFPILAVVFAYLIYPFNKEKLVKIFLYTALSFIILRFLVGFVGFPIMMKYKESRKEIAYNIANTIDINEKIAFDCASEKSICLYLDFIKNKPIFKSNHTKDWKFLITCEEKPQYKLIKSYKFKKKIVRVYER